MIYGWRIYRAYAIYVSGKPQTHLLACEKTASCEGAKRAQDFIFIIWRSR